jgi:hypothetical protein
MDILFLFICVFVLKIFIIIIFKFYLFIQILFFSQHQRLMDFNVCVFPLVVYRANWNSNYFKPIQFWKLLVTPKLSRTTIHLVS